MFNWLIILFIKLYQYCLSPLLGARCRFYPSCSEYAKEAYKQHSFFKATLLSVKRLSKCQPFFEGGVDFVPVGRKGKKI